MSTRRVVVVTGAGSGIGAALTRRLGGDGWDVFAVVRSDQHLEELSTVPNVFPIRADLRDVDEVEQAAASIRATAGSIDALVNNAGIVSAGAVATTPMKVWQDTFDTNVIGSLRITQALLPMLRRGGRIVVVSSAAAGAVVCPQGPYAASKAALEITFEALAQELFPADQRVVIVQPGIVPTPIYKNLPMGTETLSGPGLQMGLRLAAFVKAQLRQPNPVSEVVDAIVEALTSANPPLRLTVDKAELVSRRRNIDDATWVAWWGQEDDGAWRQMFEPLIGLPAPS